jgi:outer membrane protein
MKRMVFAVFLSALLGAGTTSALTLQAGGTRPAAPGTAPAAPQTQTPAPKPATTAPATAAAPPAARPPFPADAKIGYVDVQQILDQSSLGKAGTAKMKDLQDRKTAELQTKNKDIQAKQQEIQSGQTVLTQSALTQKQAELDRLQRELQLAQDQAQADIDTLNKQLLQEFQDKVLPIIQQILQEKGLWVVLTAGNNDALVAANPALDLSADVIKRLDAAK